MPRLWIAAICLALTLYLTIGTANATDSLKITGFNVEHSGEQIRVFLSDGTSALPTKEKDQKRIIRPSVSKTKKFMGWIIEHSDCCESNPAAQTLMFYRNDGRLISVKFKQTILSWAFDASGEKAIVKTGSVKDADLSEYFLYDLNAEEIVGSTAVDESDSELPFLAPPKCTDMCTDIEYQELMGTL